MWLGRGRGLIERLEAALASLEDSDVLAQAEVCTALAAVANGAGIPERGLEWAERALPLAERLHRPLLFRQAIGAKSWALFNLGRHQEALLLERGRAAFAEQSGDLVERAQILVRLANFLADDDPQESLAVNVEAAAVARRVGHRGWEHLALENGAETAIDLGEWDRARVVLDDLRELGLEAGTDRNAVAYNDAMLAALTGNARGARERLADAAEWSESTSFVQSRAWFLRARAIVGLAGGDLEAAHRDAAEARAVDPAGINGAAAVIVTARAALWLGDRDRLAEAAEHMGGFHGRRIDTSLLTARAGLAALDGRRDEAADLFARADEAWRELDSPLDLALSQLDRVLCLGTADPRGAADAEGARRFFDRLGASPFLERLAAASTTAAAPSEP
jgi:hypothetical protein